MSARPPKHTTESAAKLAARQLDKRLLRVFDALQKCQTADDENSGGVENVENPERIHQLRVACRRMAAALVLFSPLLKPGWRSVKRWVVGIRRSSGPVRDVDVFVNHLSQCALPDDLKTSLVADQKSHRADLRLRLSGSLRRAAQKRTKRQWRQRLRFRKSAFKQSVHEFSAVALVELQEHLARLLTSPQPDFAELHRIRIAAKRVRYGMEMLALNQADKNLSRQLVRIQELLGQLNDHVNAQARYQSILATLPADASAAEVAKQIISHHAQAASLQKKFHRWLRTRNKTT
ncbi:MAG: CHAD domain-containing protein [Pirellulaceae bacterium]|nr:CHAD domain-containing protein [Pirellulaceae bacterium]